MKTNIRSKYRSWQTMYLIRRPSRWASDKEWQEFLAKMLTRPQDNPDVAAAVERAREELDLRSGKATWAEIRARRRARFDALELILPPSPTETDKSEQDGK